MTDEEAEAHRVELFKHLADYQALSHDFFVMRHDLVLACAELRHLYKNIAARDTDPVARRHDLGMLDRIIPVLEKHAPQ